MDKQEFLGRLKEDLSSLTDEELQNALKYYDEYFADSHEENVEQRIEEYNEAEDFKEEVEVTETEELAQVQALSDINHAQEEQVISQRPLRKQKSMLLLVVLICFAPILLPLAVAAASTLFALLMVALSVIFALGCTAIAGFLTAGAGIFSVGYGIVQLFFMNISDGLYHISVGLVSTGIGILLAYFFGKLTFAVLKYKFRFIGFVGRKIFKPVYSGA